jgi:hypothetical protein
MSKLSNRKSVMAIVKETTEGVAVKPSAGEDFIALQDGFDMEPAFNELENAELTGSIGKAKTILGSEEPTASIAHYIRHSGIEGQAPNFGALLEALLGAEVVASVEATVVSATQGTDTVPATITVGVGEGALFQRGQALLIKNGVGGFSIRNVLSIAGDVLTLGQNLSSAPSAGVKLGKAVLYKPADENHPTLSAWLYRANGGAIELMGGARVTEGSIEANAGEFVNGSFTLAGISYSFDPIEITASNKYIDFNDGADKVAVLAEKMYKDPHELADAIKVAMQSQTSDVITVKYVDASGKFEISSDGATLELLWLSGANSANSVGETIGFDTVADDTGATSYVSDSAIELGAEFTPNFDDANPLVAKDNQVMLGDFKDISCFEASSLTASISGTKSDLPSICARTGKSGSIISEREIEVEISALLNQYDADKFKRFRQGSNIQFTYNFGEKSGGQWVAGKCANIFMPTATISSFKLEDADGLVQLSLTLKAYVVDGLGEMYLNFI